MDINGMLGNWLLSLLRSFSLAIYSSVIPLAGGREGGLWRWVLVEQGLFVLFVLLSVWFLRVVLGLGRTHNWGTGAVVAVALGLLWNWYGVTASYAIEQELHPAFGWEWTFFTWGLPLMLAGVVLPKAGFLVHLGVGMAEVAVVLLLAARAWIAAPNPVPALRKGKQGGKAKGAAAGRQAGRSRRR